MGYYGNYFFKKGYWKKEKTPPHSTKILCLWFIQGFQNQTGRLNQFVWEPVPCRVRNTHKTGQKSNRTKTVKIGAELVKTDGPSNLAGSLLLPHLPVITRFSSASSPSSWSRPPWATSTLLLRRTATSRLPSSPSSDERWPKMLTLVVRSTMTIKKRENSGTLKQ